MLTPSTLSGQRARLADIRDNLIARIAEAEHEGRLGKVEGLKVGLTGAEEKLAAAVFGLRASLVGGRVGGGHGRVAAEVPHL
ncbi:hypothetical protein GA0115254_109327 [Streptomyces sp. Ncost-T10-10d]|nr:hypothetical protein GA0115254_109327 [Streptomyces sp. Ncost-T10-10d]